MRNFHGCKSRFEIFFKLALLLAPDCLVVWQTLRRTILEGSSYKDFCLRAFDYILPCAPSGLASKSVMVSHWLRSMHKTGTLYTCSSPSPRSLGGTILRKSLAPGAKPGIEHKRDLLQTFVLETSRGSCTTCHCQ